MAFASLLIVLVAISSSAIALTEPLASMANPRGFPEQCCQGRQEGEREDNPYVFHTKSFKTKALYEAGEIRALPNFGEVSELLEGVERFRVTCIELKPNVVLLPHYIDAKFLSYVVGDLIAIAYLHQNELVKRNLEEGDGFGVPTGRTFYLVNNHHQNSLRITSILHTMRPFRG